MSKKNVKTNIAPVENIDPVRQKVEEVLEKGASNIFLVGIRENGYLDIGTTYATFEQMHAILNRALFELNHAHTQAILQANQAQEAQAA
jgi:hypothetical protein